MGTDRQAPALVICGDAGTLLPVLPTDRVDAVVTDPPWNLGRDYGRDRPAARRIGAAGGVRAGLVPAAAAPRDRRRRRTAHGRVGEGRPGYRQARSHPISIAASARYTRLILPRVA
jgi:hypothetical protein